MAINDQDELIDMLNSSSSTFFQKAIACKRLYMIGNREAIPALAAQLGEERMGHYARFALEPMPDPQVDVVFREALGNLQGPVLIGVLTSIGVRRDPEAVEPVAELMTNSDVDVARAACATLGTISGRRAAELLMAGQSRVAAEVRPVWARAALVCADRMADDEPRMAMDIYNTLNNSGMPRAVMLAARRRIMAAGI
jgi:HEAT repeat protein